MTRKYAIWLFRRMGLCWPAAVSIEVLTRTPETNVYFQEPKASVYGRCPRCEASPSLRILDFGPVATLFVQNGHRLPLLLCSRSVPTKGTLQSGRVKERYVALYISRYYIYLDSQAVQSVPLFTEPFQRLVGQGNEAITCLSWGMSSSNKLLLAVGVNNGVIHLFAIGETNEAMSVWSVQCRNPQVRPLAVGFPSTGKDEVCVVGRD